MAKKDRDDSGNGSGANNAAASVEQLLLAALARGDESGETGRFLVTFKEGASDEGIQSLRAQGMRVADARDFEEQTVAFDNLGDADTVVFPEIGVAMIGADTARERALNSQSAMALDGPMEFIEAERFVFANAGALLTDYMHDMSQPVELIPREYQNGNSTPNYAPRAFATQPPPLQAEGPNGDYMSGFLRAAELISRELLHGHNGNGNGNGQSMQERELLEEVMVLGATWGLTSCRVPLSVRSGVGIKVAVLDTGLDLGHPDFVGRAINAATFVGQPVQDILGHGTHVAGTACGTKAPAGTTPRYGIGYRSSIFAGKVLNNSGAGSSATVLAGMNWAIANRCQVISMSLGGPGGPLAAYTAAGQAALNNGLLMIAAAGNNAGPTGSPANSATIMSVAALDANLKPSSFSNFGKIDIAGPGRDVFSSWPRPTRYNTISGTSMATPHVAGCAALWAESASSLRGLNLWRRLLSSARHLPFPATRVGAGLVQAP